MAVVYCLLPERCELDTGVNPYHANTWRSRVCRITEQCPHLKGTLTNCEIKYGEYVSVSLQLNGVPI
jgi:hypothetical protein